MFKKKCQKNISEKFPSLKFCKKVCSEKHESLFIFVAANDAIDVGNKFEKKTN